ncbi:MAG: hypothetical protein IT158_17055 [Bryobacterales bacterium]|nr:hypothetical protein [Bryobacterales bacterium]
MPRASGTSDLRPDPAEVLRYLGYPKGAAPEPRIEERVLQWIEKAAGCARPQGVYEIYPAEVRGARRLALEGGATFSGAIGEFLSGVRRVAVFLTTAGPEIVELSEAAMRSRETLGGLILNSIGSVLAESVLEGILEELRCAISPEEALTLPFSPGYCGMPMTDQRTLFRLVDAPGIGVELLPTLIMRPVKSISGLIGIGPKESITSQGSPCDHCLRETCRMRR